MEHLLKKGDIFFIKKGQKLYIKENGFQDEEVIAGVRTYHQAYAQDTIKLPHGTKNRPKIRKVLTEEYLTIIEHTIPPVGEYKVIKTENTGGGTQTGMNGYVDYWPDGHKVTATPKDSKKPVVSFYQTGSFTAMLENPHIIKRNKTK